MRAFFVIAAITASLTFPASSVRADLEWNGAGDGMSVYQEANWVDPLTMLAPAAGAVDPNVEVNDHLIALTGTPGGPGGGGPNLRLGTGSLQVGGDAVFRMSQGGSAGIRVDGSDAGANYAPVTVTDSAELLAQYFSKLIVTLEGTGIITLYGGGNPLNNSTVDILSGSAELRFLNETPDAVLAEHYSKITVGGEPASELNLSIVSDGAAGSILMAVPEPSVLVLAVVGLALLVGHQLARRRRV